MDPVGKSLYSEAFKQIPVDSQQFIQTESSSTQQKVIPVAKHVLEAPEKKESSHQIRNSTAEFLIFTKQAGEGGIEVRIAEETVWLTQKLMAMLFDVTVPTINEHLANLYSQREIGKKAFFASVQNKLHFAIHGHTAAELITQRANSAKDKMGLTSWKNSPHGKILKPNVSGRVVQGILTLTPSQSCTGASRLN